MRVPGPDHPITITAEPGRLQALLQSRVIADSDETLTLQEASYAPVAYFPRKDVRTALLSRTEKTTYCPYKGVANYYTIAVEGRTIENAVWTYENPYPAMAAIKDRLAFYRDQVDVRSVDGPVVAEQIREAILHTDDGSGRSQREHWPATVDVPPDA
jgi:uncharacterized protein (DUF427 family)